jgi:hypothetical protein
VLSTAYILTSYSPCTHSCAVATLFVNSGQIICVAASFWTVLNPAVPSELLQSQLRRHRYWGKAEAVCLHHGYVVTPASTVVSSTFSIREESDTYSSYAYRAVASTHVLVTIPAMTILPTPFCRN